MRVNVLRNKYWPLTSKRMKKLFVLLSLIIIAWALWMYTGRKHAWTKSELALDLTEELLVDSACTKNVVGIQPYMLPQDYLSETRFYEKMRGYFEEARSAHYFTPNSVVLLPEYLGTWLVINEEKRSVAEARSIQSAMTWIVLSNPFSFLKYFLKHQDESDRFAATIFRMKSEAMASIYGNTFKKLAKEYGVTINAGSIVLPGAIVQNNQITVEPSRPLYNTSFVFLSTGEIDTRIVKKSFPISSELPFVSPAPIEELPLYDLPIGKTVILVCADSWYPESYARINELNAEVILVNSYCATDDMMAEKWKGYDGIRRPLDVDTTDIQQLQEIFSSMFIKIIFC